jgi:hypothetical protein
MIYFLYRLKVEKEGHVQENYVNSLVDVHWGILIILLSSLQEDYAKSTELLAPLKYKFVKIGGSDAQVSQTNTNTFYFKNR